jgi:hypothetical protein
MFSSNWTTIFEWCVVKLALRNISKDMAFKEIELNTQNMLASLSSISPRTWGTPI